MAIFNGGALVGEIRGSAGGLTFSRNTHGQYIRTRAKPVNPNTMRQSQARQRVETIQSAWRNTLTQLQRTGWDDYAKGSPVLNKLGNQTILSGLNMFLRYNAIYLQAGGTLRSAPPPVNGIKALPVVTITGDTTDGIVITTLLPALAANDAMIAFISPPKSFTVNFFGSGFTQTVPSLGVMTLPFELVPAASLAIGQRYFIDFRAAFANGVPSERFLQHVDILA